MQYEINGQIWTVEPSFFDDCIDLIHGHEVITVKASASHEDITRAILRAGIQTKE